MVPNNAISGFTSKPSKFNSKYRSLSPQEENSRSDVFFYSRNKFDGNNTISQKKNFNTISLFKTTIEKNPDKSLFRNVSLTLKRDPEIRKKLLRTVFKIRVYQIIFLNIMTKILKKIKNYGVSKIIFDINFRPAEQIRNKIYYLSKFDKNESKSLTNRNSNDPFPDIVKKE